MECAGTGRRPWSCRPGRFTRSRRPCRSLGDHARRPPATDAQDVHAADLPTLGLQLNVGCQAGVQPFGFVFAKDTTASSSFDIRGTADTSYGNSTRFMQALRGVETFLPNALAIEISGTQQPLLDQGWELAAFNSHMDSNILIVRGNSSVTLHPYISVSTSSCVVEVQATPSD